MNHVEIKFMLVCRDVQYVGVHGYLRFSRDRFAIVTSSSVLLQDVRV